MPFISCDPASSACASRSLTTSSGSRPRAASGKTRTSTMTLPGDMFCTLKLVAAIPEAFARSCTRLFSKNLRDVEPSSPAAEKLRPSFITMSTGFRLFFEAASLEFIEATSSFNIRDVDGRPSTLASCSFERIPSSGDRSLPEPAFAGARSSFCFEV